MALTVEIDGKLGQVRRRQTGDEQTDFGKRKEAIGREPGSVCAGRTTAW